MVSYGIREGEPVSNEIEYLVNGHKKFRQRYFEEDHSLYKGFVKYGQRPRFIVIACSDSRVDPSVIMNCQPGDLFVIRNVANLVPPCEIDTHYHGTSAALEFGIRNLKIKDIVVLGHSQCGGITALLESAKENKKFEENSFLSKWMELAKPACNHTLLNHPNLSTLEQAEICGKTSILRSLENLNTFSWVNSKVKEEELFLHAWYFDLSTGTINFFDQKEQKFDALI